ncbi:PE domain-containing protein [Mycobacterium tuberculosis]
MAARAAAALASTAPAGPAARAAAAAPAGLSAAVASLFSGHAQAYQTLGTQAAASRTVYPGLATGCGRIWRRRGQNASSRLQQALNDQRAHADAARAPLIGNGTNGAPGTGQAGGPGGLLYGNGGNGGSGGSAKPAELAAAPG